MPLEWVAIRYAAQNQTVSGSFEACITVPAVTEVCRRQEAHSQVNALLDKLPTLAVPAARTAEAVRPAYPRQIRRTRPLIREAALKLDERTGKVGHDGAPTTCSLFVLHRQTAAVTTFRGAGARGISLKLD